MIRLWRMFRFIRYIQNWETYLETKSEKKFLEIRKGRMEVTVVTTGFAGKYGYTDWLALDILNACEAERFVNIEAAHIDEKTKNILKVVTITPRDGQDFATWTGFMEYVLLRRSKLLAFISGSLFTGFVYLLYKVVATIIKAT